MAEDKTKAKDLWEDKDYMAKCHAFAEILNRDPLPEWIKVLPNTKDVQYIPIEIIEWEMSTVFGNFWTEIKSIQQIGNSIVCSVTVHYYNPVVNVWEMTEGCGAAPILADNGDMAIAMAVPAAKTFAKKDAMEEKGKVFGRDLNRADKITYSNLAKKSAPEKDIFPLFINALKTYTGTDKMAIQAQMQKANKDKSWSDELIKDIATKLNVKL